ncbi:metallophosphoesterase [Pseudomonas sp. P2757]|uniref:metallophosphoesterase n=1 Tax=unclassified Pseudomonas TaxID=196821 RepID=UPI003B5AE149
MNNGISTWLCPLLVAMGAVAGCANGPKGVPVDPGKDWTQSGKTELTQPIALIADTQIHESRGVASRYFNRSGDEVVPVTLRTGQQVIGAADILAYAMERAKSYPLVVHAGDAIDVSCSTEWNLFMAAMGASGRPGPGPTSWLFAPGNHDGFLTGNMYPKDDADGRIYVKSYWSNLCNAGQVWSDHQRRYSQMPKEEIVSRYAAMLARDTAVDSKNPNCNPDGSLCWATRIRRGDLQWTSYIVQRVRLPAAQSGGTPVYALLLDSSDFDQRPYLKPSGLAGLRAGVSTDQLRALKHLTADLPSEARYFFIAHHPFDVWSGNDWSIEKRDLWNELNGDPRSLHFLVSAHTHTGALLSHNGEYGSLTELNTGSLSDAPVYLRNLKFEADSRGAVGFRSAAIPLIAKQSSPNCDGAQLSKSSDEWDYSVRNQDTESDRTSTYPKLIRYTAAAFSAVGHWFKFWSGKHEELRPQLLAYADVAERTMPASQEFKYYPFGERDDHGTPMRPVVLRGPAEVAQKLRANANCDTGAGFCSAQAKGNLLLALDTYYWLDPATPQTVKDKAHSLRLCMALAAAAESPYPGSSEQDKVNTITRSVSVEWSGRLSPGSSLAGETESAKR